VLIVPACSAGGGGGAKPGTAARPSVNEAVLHYGYGPATDGSAHYQPGVVVIRDGPAAIRSASTDGLTWAIDAKADGASQLKVGSVMVATSEATGRVAELSDDGGNRIVTLAPVNLTDIVTDGDMNISQSLDPASFVYQEIPDLPGKVSDATVTPQVTPGATTSGARDVVLPPVRLIALSDIPLPSSGSKNISLGNGWSVEPSYKPGSIGLAITKESGSGLKVTAELSFPTDNLHLDTGDHIQGGQESGHRFLLEGIKGLDINVKAGAGHGSLDNGQIKVEVPIELKFSLPPSPETLGLPIDIKIAFAFSVETALTGNNATLTATGSYGLNGPIGIDSTGIKGPSFTVNKSIIDSITGITLGPSGIAAAVKMKVQAGTGVLGASAGPFGEVTTSIGLTNGSSLGAPLARCKSATLDMLIGGGASVEIPDVADKVLTAILPDGTEIPKTVSAETNVLHREQVVPDVPLCKGS
jgi:hypothetical protein